MAVDEAVLMEFVGKAVGDLGSAMTAASWWSATSSASTRRWRDAGPLTPAELAEQAPARPSAMCASG